MASVYKVADLPGRLRHAAVVSLDTILAASSLLFAVYLRVGKDFTAEMIEGMLRAVPAFALIAIAVFHAIGLYRRVWRYTSLTDLLILVEAATLSISILLVFLLVIGRVDWMPRSIPVIQWLVLVVLMGGARIARRMYCEYRRGDGQDGMALAPAAAIGRRALVVGSCDKVEPLLRLLETRQDAGFSAVGILDHSGRHVRMRLRGVPVLGASDALEHVVKQLEARGERPECLILTEPADAVRGSSMVRMISLAESLNLKVACLSGVAELSSARKGELDLRFIDMSELIGRPQADLNINDVARAIAGHRVLVTGAGGTIGSELVRQIAMLGPSELILLDSCEFNLYNIDLELKENHADVKRVPVLCSIRQRQQVMEVFARYRPDFVFHAAALKHVPLVEQHPCAGVQTNVLGTRNVADAARKFAVRAMVQVSTDKAVNPVGLMGATKRLGELYCQALDLDGQGIDGMSRFLIVRFGNVIGSSGSLIPLFQRQLSRGEPLTVTHPDIERYFMTVHEAVQLILQSTASALAGSVRRGRIFVLDMGKPIKIMDIARRMIRLAGFEPDSDVEIKIVGLRPGEKLYEELFDEGEARLPSATPGIFEAEPRPVSLAVLNEMFNEIEAAAANNDDAKVRSLIAALLNDDQLPKTETFHFAWPSTMKQQNVASHAA